jgi:hypothetical protein
MLQFRKSKRLLLAAITMAATAIALVVPAMASAECSALVSHTAAVYSYSNGTGFLKNKYEGEEVTGPQNGDSWFAGSEYPWVAVYVSGEKIGYMDFNEIDAYNDCYDPW